MVCIAKLRIVNRIDGYGGKKRRRKKGKEKKRERKRERKKAEQTKKNVISYV